jgi:hypothetical protein
MELEPTKIEYDGFNISYLASLSNHELNQLLEYLTKKEIDAEKYLKLLILNTESMDADERQGWFNILPSMTPSQVRRLLDILIIEHNKLIALQIKYQKEIKALNEKHLAERESRNTT